MASSLNGTGITFSDGSILNTNNVNIQTFNAGGGTTWTKPTAGQTMVKIQVWAGGGGGGRHSSANQAGAGGGGAYNEFICPISYMGATATVTVGAAGVGRTGSNGNGTTGGDSSVVVANYPSGSKTVIAYGGGGGGSGGTRRGSGGGGLLGAGQINTADNLGFGGKGYCTFAQLSYAQIGSSNLFTGSAGLNPALGGDPTAGGNGGMVNGCSSYGAGGSVWGGGGGGVGANTAGFGGGNSYYGGGGGASGTTAGAGTSFYGGNGGANAAGTTPSGGGGCSPSANVNGSDGGAGRVVITSW